LECAESTISPWISMMRTEEAGLSESL